MLPAFLRNVVKIYENLKVNIRTQISSKNVEGHKDFSAQSSFFQISFEFLTGNSGKSRYFPDKISDGFFLRPLAGLVTNLTYCFHSRIATSTKRRNLSRSLISLLEKKLQEEDTRKSGIRRKRSKVDR